MADCHAGFVPDFVEKEEPREIILKLGKMVTNRIPVKLGMQKLTKYDPEYWGLSLLLTDEMAEIALKMGVRKPRTFDELLKLTGKDPQTLEKLLEEMSFAGVIEYNWENPTHTKQWVLPMFVPGSAEFSNMNDTILKKHPEMGRFFERMSRLPLEKVTPMVPPGGAGIGMHVIPVEKAIGTENQSISVERISHWLNKYEGKYAASPCSCRKSRMTFDEGCADDPEGWCVAVGDMADYVVETGKGGRYITKEEALEIFRQGEENGFVHQITNIDGENKIFAICNCNINVCYSPVIFEKNEKPGGMLRYGIPSFKLEKDVIDAEIEIIKAMGVEIKCGIEVGKDVTLDELRAEGYKTFYIAIGCQGGKKANIPGEDAEGVMTAVEFLRTVGADESYPVTGKAVVVGGGNVAIDVARTAARCGAESVKMFCLEPREKMPASEEEIGEALEENVELSCGWGPKEIRTENGKVTGIVFKRCVSVWDENGRFSPTYDENDTKTVPCDRVFLSIGQSIQWGDLLAGSKVELGRGNGAVADPLTYQTGEPDIFVGGDVYTGPKFAIDAIAAGREGAISIHRFVQPHSSLTIGRNRRDFIALDKDNIRVEQYDNGSRQIPGVRKDIDRKKSFRDAKLTFTEAQVKAETARCLGCGASVVDPNKCIGCGVCTTKCEFGAIKLHRERPECSKMIPSEKKLPYVLGNGAKQALKIKLGLAKKE